MAGPSPSLIWTKSKSTTAFVRETFPSSRINRWGWLQARPVHLERANILNPKVVPKGKQIDAPYRKIGGEDKMLQSDKQTDATLQKLVVRIKPYKQTDATLRESQL